MDKRKTLAFMLACGAAGSLLGCGFALRRASPLPFKRLQITGFAAYSPIATELKRQVNATGTTRVVESMAQADMIFLCLREARERNADVQTAYAQVRDQNLTATLRFMVRTPDGRVLITPTDITESRTMTYNETQALAKDQEADSLFLAMQIDIVSQLMLRLAKLKPATH